MANKNSLMKQDKEFARKCGQNKKGKKHKDTIIREKISKTFEEQAGELIEKNMLEFMNSEDKDVRLQATRYFSEYIKPKKRELSGAVTVPIMLVTSDDITAESDLNEIKPENED